MKLEPIEYNGGVIWVDKEADVNSIINKLDTPEGLDQYSYDEGFKEGYKAAQSKGRYNEEELAKLFHDTYERLAPEFGYATREDTKVFDQNSANGKLMVAVCNVILQSLSQPTERCYSEEEVANMKAALITAKNRMEEDAKCWGESGLLPEDVVYSAICEAIRYDGAKTEFPSQPIEPMQFLANQAQELKMGYEPTEEVSSKDTHKHFWGLVEDNIQCLYCGASKENGFKHTEPNQTLAEKILEDACPVLFKPNTDVRKAILKAMEEYASLGRTTTIQEIEEWAKANFFTLGGDQKYIDIKDLLTKLNNLKQ